MEVKLSDTKVKELQQRYNKVVKESFEDLRFQLNQDIDDIDWDDIKNLIRDIEEFQIRRDFANIIFDECKLDK